MHLHGAPGSCLGPMGRRPAPLERCRTCRAAADAARSNPGAGGGAPGQAADCELQPARLIDRSRSRGSFFFFWSLFVFFTERKVYSSLRGARRCLIITHRLNWRFDSTSTPVTLWRRVAYSGRGLVRKRVDGLRGVCSAAAAAAGRRRAQRAAGRGALRGVPRGEGPRAALGGGASGRRAANLRGTEHEHARGPDVACVLASAWDAI